MDDSPVIVMSEREFNQRFSEVLDRVERGARVIVTRAGEPTVELKALPGARERRAAIDERNTEYPPVDRELLRREVEMVLVPPKDGG